MTILQSGRMTTNQNLSAEVPDEPNGSKTDMDSDRTLRSHVVTQMMKSNINPFFLHAITDHKVPGTSSVVLGYVRPTVSEVRKVLELLE